MWAENKQEEKKKAEKNLNIFIIWINYILIWQTATGFFGFIQWNLYTF